MAASNSVLHPRKFNHFCYDPLFKSNRGGALNYHLPSSNFSPTLRLLKSPISTNSFNFTSSSTNFRRLPAIISASSEKSSETITQFNSSSPEMIKSSHQQLLHHFSLRMILEVITFIWRLPSFIAEFLKKEEKVLDTIEEEIIETANVVKGGAKVVEEIAEGLEDVAECLQKTSNVLEKDAKKVDAIMDEVKEKTKTAHDELEEVVGSLKGPVQDMEKDVAKVQAKVKGSKEEITTSPTTIEPPPPLATTIDPNTKNTNTLHYKSFQDSILLWRPQILLHSFIDLLQWPHVHVYFEFLSYLMSLPRVFSGTMIMVSFILLLSGKTNTPLMNYAF